MSRLLLGLCVSTALIGQVADEANTTYKTKEGRASVAEALSRPGRDAQQKPEELIAALEITKGTTVIDLGTGVGYMLPHLSRAVGPNGKVVAEDIHQDFLKRARAKAKREQLQNVEFILGTDQDPKLQPGSADLIFVLDSYHHFDYPERMLHHLKKALRPGGRLAIVEFYKRRGAMGNGDPDRALHHIRVDADDLVKEVEAAGFHLLSRRDHVADSQYLAIFSKK